MMTDEQFFNALENLTREIRCKGSVNTEFRYVCPMHPVAWKAFNLLQNLPYLKRRYRQMMKDSEVTGKEAVIVSQEMADNLPDMVVIDRVRLPIQADQSCSKTEMRIVRQ